TPTAQRLLPNAEAGEDFGDGGFGDGLAGDFAEVFGGNLQVDGEGGEFKPLLSAGDGGAGGGEGSLQLRLVAAVADEDAFLACATVGEGVAHAPAESVQPFARPRGNRQRVRWQERTIGAGQVDLVCDQQAPGRQLVQEAGLVVLGAGPPHRDQEDQIGGGQFGAGAADADLLHRIVGVAQAGGVGQADRDAVEVERLLDQIARGARHVGDDGPLLPEEGVEQAGLADIGPPGDDDG